MSALDVSIVNTVLPVINRDFSTDIATLEWIVVVYLLLVSGLLPGFGRLGDLRGHKIVFLLGFGVFILGSLLCGLASGVYVLIAARAVQALGAAMLSSNSPAILTKAFPSTQRGQALGLQATLTYLGLTVGPTLGGWLADSVTWRAAFWVNIPVGLLAAWLSWQFIHTDHSKKEAEPFDWLGSGLFLVGLVLLLLVLNQGHNWGWTSWLLLSALATAISCLVFFAQHELRTPNPMLDFKLFRLPGFAVSVSAAILNYMCVYSIIFLLPFYLMSGRALTPSEAGLILSTQPIIMAIAAPISGTLSDHIGTRLPSFLGMLILSIGLFFLARLTPSTPPAYVALRLTITGLGIGIFISPNTSALMGAAPSHRQGIAAGILATSRNVGMVLGVGFSGAIFTTILQRAPSSGNDALFQAIGISFSGAILIALLGAFLTNFQSYRQ